MTSTARRSWRRRGAHALAAAVLLLPSLLVLDRLFPLPLPDRALRSSVVVTARDGTRCAHSPSENGVWRYPVDREDVSPLYVEALVGYEDRWFWRHPGSIPLR